MFVVFLRLCSNKLCGNKLCSNKSSSAFLCSEYFRQTVVVKLGMPFFKSTKNTDP